MQRFLFSFILLCFTCQILSAQEFDVLVFSKTQGFRHGSIPSGQSALQELGEANNFSVTLSENSDDFTIENLLQYECIVFLSTTGDILNSEQQQDFEAYIEQGGGYVGIHAASDTEYSWPWYGDLVGAYFDSHPAIQEATIEVADHVHPSTSFLPGYWQRNDEWYNFRTNPRGRVHVLATLDESSYDGGNMGHDHPTAWCHEYEGGRAWYTGGGHTNESFSNDLFRQHILGGILYATGSVAGDFTATINDKFELNILDNDPKSPMALTVLPSLDVLYIERAGKVKLWKQSSGQIMTIASLNVSSGREDGLIGITLDPDFETNNWLYLFYSPTGVDKQFVSRFKFINDELDLDSEQIILEIPVQRAECCHSGGDLEFDGNGNLYIATGDNTNPFESNGFAPIDERAGRSAFDAQGTSANTNDLRGKVLRIHPEEDGSYSIPEGNLFPAQDAGLPEIYVMGTRNPFRLAVHKNGELVWGDVGPDGSSDSASRGPRGYDEINRTKVAGNFGWPYLIADNKAYNDYNFATSASGAKFDANNLVNDSPNNTGASTIPPAIPAWIYYHYGNNPNRPEFNASGGRSILGGSYFHYNAERADPSGLPKYFDDVLIVGDWSRNWIKELRLDDEGNLLQINPLIPHIDLNSPIDIEIGPDGNMYIVEWGNGFGNDNPDARIIKIIYQSIAGNSAPIALISADVESGVAPLTVAFDGSLSKDPDIGDQLSFSWDFNDDGVEDANEVNPSFTYTENGVFNATLEVTDESGIQAVAQVQVVVGNTAPSLNIDFPANGGFFAIGDTIVYAISTNDVEDGNECDQNLPLGIKVEPSIGHDDHSHGVGDQDGCNGEFITSPHGDGSDDVFYVLNAQYEDRGGAVDFPLTTKTFNILQPKLKQAQHAQELNDLRTENTGDFLGGDVNMAYINDGSYLMYTPMNFENIEFLTVRWAALNIDSKIEVHIDAPDGPIIAERNLPVTGGWQDYDFYTMDLKDPGGTHDVYLVFRNPGKNSLGNINFMEFHGKGISLSDHQAGMGLTATYYSNDDFTGSSVVRNEPMISWDWDNDSPVEGIPADGFSVRWEGQIVAPATTIYNISTLMTGGTSAVYIDRKSVNNGSFEFVAGQFYSIVVEYVYGTGNAAMALKWEGAQPLNVIHTQYLRTIEMTSGIGDFYQEDARIFPNPFDQFIQVPEEWKGQGYQLVSIDGRVVRAGKLNHKIQTADLVEGIYILEIAQKRFKLVKSKLY
ncbi:ThuA domain-containing protein [Portibacter lacus]|uniref:Carbohydrate-binding protein n=1 Tax=Portibacter lacus TaxID=1099794 RepID=A0AA37SM97_9BACT|nr:ThuA domain-containing protein [Portibacter lacus]GLR16510.1 hypothetical protein GCM10007940_11250 [Portibacter lacus]